MALNRTDKQRIYDQLHNTELTHNHLWLACIIASWTVGESVLPDYLGLSPDEFYALKQHYFPNQDLPNIAPSNKQLDFDRMLERQDLINLLKDHAQPKRIETDWIIGILVAACLGEDHLWQDLGLWSRAQLTALLYYNFPELAARNTHDMKWKKFIYKQLCEAEGLYLCRAPSCGVCVDYSKCYGSEE